MEDQGEDGLGRRPRNLVINLERWRSLLFPLSSQFRHDPSRRGKEGGAHGANGGLVNEAGRVGVGAPVGAETARLHIHRNVG